MADHKEDFNKLKLISRAMKNAFAESWDFRVDITLPSGANVAGHGDLFRVNGSSHIAPFDLYAKELSFGPTEIETEPVKAGGNTLTFPTGAAPVLLNLTMRDNKDRMVYDWFKSLAALVVNSDGTVNLPVSYIMTMTLYSVETGKKFDEFKVFPQKMGDITNSLDGETLEFPIAFTQFNSGG